MVACKVNRGLIMGLESSHRITHKNGNRKLVGCFLSKERSEGIFEAYDLGLFKIVSRRGNNWQGVCCVCTKSSMPGDSWKGEEQYCTSELGLFLFWLKHYVKHFWMYAITVGVSPLTFPLCAYNFHPRVLVEWLMSLNSLISQLMIVLR